MGLEGLIDPVPLQSLIAQYEAYYGEYPDDIYPLPPEDFYEIDTLVSLLVNQQVIPGTEDYLKGFDASANYILFAELNNASQYFLRHKNQTFTFNVIYPPGTYLGGIRGFILSHGRLMVLFENKVVSTYITSTMYDILVDPENGSGTLTALIGT